MTPVERIKNICKDRKIAISRLEQSCGFSNGYIRNLKNGMLPADKLKDVAAFLDVPMTYLVTGSDLETPFNDDQARIVSHLRTDPELVEALKKYFELPQFKKEHVLETIRILHDY